ncbi:MAG: hypothetical protein IKU42_06505 [Oscillospiraceae bacterium]|nr:hypothetical protein [Oscillospiraceae bacterium]
MAEYKKRKEQSGSYTVEILPKSEGTKIPVSSSEKTEPVKQENKTETSIAELRNNYAKQLRAQYDTASDKLRAEKEDALRENWILEQQEEAGLSEKLAREGINGGAAETTLSGIRSKYQGNRNDIQKGYISDLGELYSEHAEQQAKNAKDYDEKWLDYLISIAEKEYDYNREFKNILG